MNQEQNSEEVVEATEDKYISREDLATLKDAQSSIIFMEKQEEVIKLKKENALLNAKNVLLQIFLKYGLSESNIINDSIGRIDTKEKEC